MEVIAAPDVLRSCTPCAKSPADEFPEPTEPIALSLLEVAPKLYISPLVIEPVLAAYVVPVPVLCEYQFVIVELFTQALLVPVEESVLKFWVLDPVVVIVI